MSAKATNVVWKWSRAAGSELALMLAIANRTGKDGWAEATVAELAEDIRIVPRQTHRLLGACARRKELQIAFFPGGKSKYKICLGKDNVVIPTTTDNGVIPRAPRLNLSPPSPPAPPFPPRTEDSENRRILRQVTENRSDLQVFPLKKQEVDQVEIVRARDEIWDAVEEAFGFSAETHGERSRRGKVVVELKALGATPGEIKKRWQRFIKIHGQETARCSTELALIHHWSRLNGKAEKKQQAEWKCPECGKEFTSTYDRREHRRDEHGVED